MKNSILSIIAILMLSMATALPVSAQSFKNNGALRVILIRHGEKPDNGDNLSCAGFNRSIKLPAVLKAKFGIPDYIYIPGPATGKQTKDVRMLETITPFAVRCNLSLNTSCTVDDAQGLAQKITKNSGTVLVVWEHKELPEIAAALGIRNPPEWKPGEYDSIWIVTIRHGHATLSIDREGISPPESCPF